MANLRMVSGTSNGGGAELERSKEDQKRAELEGNEEEAAPESKLPAMKPLPSTSGTQSFAQSVIARKKAEQRERERDSFSLLKGASSLLKESERGRGAEEEGEAEQDDEPVDEGPVDPKEAAGKLTLNDSDERGQRLDFCSVQGGAA